MKNKKVWIVLVLIVLVGAWFRIAGQDQMSLRADSLEFWRICGQQITGSQIVGHWLEIMGLSGQFPFPMAFTKWFMDAFSLPLTLLNLRLPSILWGLLTVVFAYGLGRRFAGPGCGLFLAALLALNAFHIQMTREAYYYPPMTAGAFLATWGLVWAVQRWRRPAAESLGAKIGYVLVNAGGFGLLIYSQPTGFFPAILCSAGVGVVELMNWWRTRRITWVPVGLLAGYLLLGFPMLLVPWGLSQLRQITSGELKEAAVKVLSVSQENPLTLLGRGATIFAWGTTPLRVAVLVLVSLAGLWQILRNLRKSWEYVLIPYLVVGVFLSFLYARSHASALFEPRYLIGLLPAYLLLLALGLLSLADLARKALQNRGALKYAWMLIPAFGLALLVYPAWLCARMTGQPTPYLTIQHWMNTHLPRQTPVLVDRWFEPWNELAVHPSTNVVFTFTLPNEPVDVFLQTQWRETAKEFCAKFPDAAYLEIAKTYWYVPAVGPWQWPREYFAQHASLRNDAGIQLRDLGLAARTDYYAADTNRLEVEVFWNTRDDVLARAQRQGGGLIPWYGEGWGYTKLWRQIQGDFRDWRVLDRRAVLEVLNGGAQPVQGQLFIRAVALQGAKRVTFNGAQAYDFPPSRLVETTVGPFEFKPGVTPVILADALGLSDRIPLLVESMEIRPAPVQQP